MKVVLFDGICNLCNGFVNFTIRHDRQSVIRFAALQSDVAARLLGGIDIQSLSYGSVIYIRHGKIHLRSSAALYILKDLGGVWKLSAILFVVPRFLRDFFYDLIARYRYRWFGKRESCMVPDPKNLQRFLS